jgi:hypothetical protein
LLIALVRVVLINVVKVIAAETLRIILTRLISSVAIAFSSAAARKNRD